MCAKCGGSMKKGGTVKKVKKMAQGGQMGIPQTGPTGPNIQGVDTMKRGGMVKKQNGGSTDNGRSVEKKTFSTSNKMYDLAGKKKIVSRDGETVKTKTKTTITPNQPGSITNTGKPVTRVSVSKGDGPARTRRAIIPVKAKGGSLKPVSADQKGLAKLPTAVRNKMGYQKKGGIVKKQLGGTATSTNPNPTRTLENLGMFIGGGLGTAIAARKQNQPMSEKKKEKVLAKQQKKSARKSK